MINGKYINQGKEGIVYKCNDGTALKIFFRSPEIVQDPFSGRTVLYFGNDERAKREYDVLCTLFDAGVNVPKPIGIEEVILDDADLKYVGQLRSVCCHEMHPLNLSGRKLPAVRKQFIRGVSLYDRLIPSLKIRRNIQELHKNIDKVGFSLMDVKADNYVVTPEGKVYLIDCGFMYKHTNTTSSTWMQKRITTCKFEDWLELLILSLKEGDVI